MTTNDADMTHSTTLVAATTCEVPDCTDRETQSVVTWCHEESEMPRGGCINASEYDVGGDDE
ncbi:MAG: hypothetical protein ACYDBQ_06170 [Thermoplasmatota archaeon]